MCPFVNFTLVTPIMKATVSNNKRKKRTFRDLFHEIIFEADTPAGKFFDVILLLLILVSIAAVMLETIPSYQLKYGRTLYYLEWGLTFCFTIEYGLRIYAVNRPFKYIFSFFGLVDLLSIAPSYLSIFFAGTQSLIVIRAFSCASAPVPSINHPAKIRSAIYFTLILLKGSFSNTDCSLGQVQTDKRPKLSWNVLWFVL